MDFKVAGTHKGITAIQLDMKIVGISKEIIRDSPFIELKKQELIFLMKL